MYPSGKIIKNGELNQQNIGEVADELQKSNFTGYLAATVKQKTGIEDVSVAFVNGKVKGAFFENFKTKERLSGEKALEKMAKTEGTGFYDAVSLSPEQVDLAIAVRPESEVKTKQTVQNETNKGEKLETNEEILKRYGLTQLVNNA